MAPKAGAQYRFKGLPTKEVGGYELPDDTALEKAGLASLATAEHPSDIGRMGDDDARLRAGQEVAVREVVPSGEPGAGPVNEVNVVVEWDDGLRAMSFTEDQFDSLFEEVA